jgi:hypothetical protein
MYQEYEIIREGNQHNCVAIALFLEFDNYYTCHILDTCIDTKGDGIGFLLIVIIKF